MKQWKTIVAFLVLCPSLALAQPGGSWDQWFYWGPDQTGQTQLSDAIHLIHLVPQPEDTVRAFTVGYGTPRRWRLAPTLPWYGEYVYEAPSPYALHFCAGHSALADGRILTAGANFNECHIQADLYDPFSALWNPTHWPHPGPRPDHELALAESPRFCYIGGGGDLIDHEMEAQS